MFGAATGTELSIKQAAVNLEGKLAAATASADAIPDTTGLPLRAVCTGHRGGNASFPSGEHFGNRSGTRTRTGATPFYFLRAAGISWNFQVGEWRGEGMMCRHRMPESYGNCRILLGVSCA